MLFGIFVFVVEALTFVPRLATKLLCNWAHHLAVCFGCNLLDAAQTEAKVFLTTVTATVLGSYTALRITERTGLVKPRRVMRWVAPGSCGVIAALICGFVGQRRALARALQETARGRQS